MKSPSNRRVPVNPYASEPLEVWLDRLRGGASVDERFRGFLAVTSLMSPTDALPAVLATLTDAAGDLRAAAANWIGNAVQRAKLSGQTSATAQVIERLTPLLHDADPDVQLSSARALSWLIPGSPDLLQVVTDLLAREDSQPTSLAVLAEICGRVPQAGRDNLSRLRQLLGAEQAEVRESAAQALVKLGIAAAPAIEELVAALEDEDPLVREAAAIALGQVGPLPASALTALQAAATDEDPGVAAAARHSADHRTG